MKNGLKGIQETNTPSFGGDLLDGTDWVEVKTWLSKSDERVRETHAYLDGQLVHAEAEFTSKSGAKAQYPGGFGVAAEDINCRCTVKYTLMKKDEFLAQGGIIPGEENSADGLTDGGEGGIIKEQERMKSSSDYAVPKDLTQSRAFREKFNSMDSDTALQREYYQAAKEMLEHRSGTNGEDLYYYNTRLKKWYKSTTGTEAGTPEYTEEITNALKKAEKGDIVSFHNHPLGMPPSAGDLNAALKNGYQKGYTIGHNGVIFEYTAPKFEISGVSYNYGIKSYIEKGYTEFEAQLKTLSDLQKLYEFKFRQVE